MATTKEQSEARVTVSLRVSQGAVQAVDKIAAKERRSRSQVLRLLLEEAIKARQ